MQLFNKPLYMSLKEKMAQQPANAEQWNDLMGKGLQAAEIANLVALRRVEASKVQWLRGAADLQCAQHSAGRRGEVATVGGHGASLPRSRAAVQ